MTSTAPLATDQTSTRLRDWRTMTRHDFDGDAPPPTLFALEPDQTAVHDACGTGDLLELLGGDAVT